MKKRETLNEVNFTYRKSQYLSAELMCESVYGIMF